MKKIMCIISLIFLCVLVFVACNKVELNDIIEVSATQSHTPQPTLILKERASIEAEKTAELTDESMSNISDNSFKITIGDKEFDATLADNDTAQAFMELLPMTIDMGDLNSNEKYYYLDNSIASNAQNVGRVNAGDIMLYGKDCLVVFYENFNTAFSYTKIGNINDASTLKATLGAGSVEINFTAD